MAEQNIPFRKSLFGFKPGKVMSYVDELLKNSDFDQIKIEDLEKQIAERDEKIASLEKALADGGFPVDENAKKCEDCDFRKKAEDLLNETMSGVKTVSDYLGAGNSEETGATSTVSEIPADFSFRFDALKEAIDNLALKLDTFGKNIAVQPSSETPSQVEEPSSQPEEKADEQPEETAPEAAATEENTETVQTVEDTPEEKPSDTADVPETKTDSMFGEFETPFIQTFKLDFGDSSETVPSTGNFTVAKPSEEDKPESEPVVNTADENKTAAVDETSDIIPEIPVNIKRTADDVMPAGAKSPFADLFEPTPVAAVPETPVVPETQPAPEAPAAPETQPVQAPAAPVAQPAPAEQTAPVQPAPAQQPAPSPTQDVIYTRPSAPVYANPVNQPVYANPAAAYQAPVNPQAAYVNNPAASQYGAPVNQAPVYGAPVNPGAPVYGAPVNPAAVQYSNPAAVQYGQPVQYAAPVQPRPQPVIDPTTGLPVFGRIVPPSTPDMPAVMDEIPVFDIPEAEDPKVDPFTFVNSFRLNHDYYANGRPVAENPDAPAGQ